MGWAAKHTPHGPGGKDGELMFVGHYATALLARRLEPRLPLWVLFIAAQLVDVFWAVFVVAEVEHVRIVPGFTNSNPLDLHYMPFTHSLIPATLAWAVLAAIGWRLLRPKDPSLGAMLVGLVVASHWLLDLPMHRPDLPLLWDCCKQGLGLWDSRWLSLGLELALLASAAFVAAPEMARRRRFVGLIVVMAALQVIAALGPAPTTVLQVSVAGLIGYLLLAAVAAWADRPANRSPDGEGSA